MDRDQLINVYRVVENTRSFARAAFVLLKRARSSGSFCRPISGTEGVLRLSSARQEISQGKWFPFSSFKWLKLSSVRCVYRTILLLPPVLNSSGGTASIYFLNYVYSYELSFCIHLYAKLFFLSMLPSCPCCQQMIANSLMWRPSFSPSFFLVNMAPYRYRLVYIIKVLFLFEKKKTARCFSVSTYYDKVA